MLRIRKVQIKIDAHYLENEMKTPVHLYIGQEAIAVGVCSNLNRDDYINSNHRSHGHYLAKGGSLRALIAELFCRETGCSKGRGGSMHLVDVSVGHYGSSSIVGGGIPIATGLGMSIQMQRQSAVSVVFFGDGAADEGVLYESINFAVLKKLPVIYILENNQFSVCSHVSVRQAGDNVFHAMPGDLLYTKIIDGNNVLAIREASGRAVARAREGQGPSFLECRTYRILGHAGCEAQDPSGYRSSEDIQSWKRKCPVSRLRKNLLKKGIITLDMISDMERRIDEEIDDAFEYAKKSPLPTAATLHRYLFCE